MSLPIYFGAHGMVDGVMASQATGRESILMIILRYERNEAFNF